MPKTMVDYLNEVTARGDEHAVILLVHAQEDETRISAAARAAIGTHVYVVPKALDYQSITYATVGELTKRFAPSRLRGLKVCFLDWSSKMLFASATLTDTPCSKQRSLRAQATHLGQAAPLPTSSVQALLTVEREAAN